MKKSSGIQRASSPWQMASYDLLKSRSQSQSTKYIAENKNGMFHQKSRNLSTKIVSSWACVAVAKLSRAGGSGGGQRLKLSFCKSAQALRPRRLSYEVLRQSRNRLALEIAWSNRTSKMFFVAALHTASIPFWMHSKPKDEMQPLARLMVMRFLHKKALAFRFRNRNSSQL